MLNPQALVPITIDTPAPGCVWEAQVPAERLWRIVRVQMTFVASTAFPGSEARIAVLNAARQGKLIHPSFIIHPPGTESAPTILRYLFAPGVYPTAGTLTGVPNGLDVTAPLSDPCIVFPHWWVIGSVGNITASDQIKDVSMVVEEYSLCEAPSAI